MTTILLLGAGGSAAANVTDALRRADRGYRIVGADASPVKLHLAASDERVVVPRCRCTAATSQRSVKSCTPTAATSRIPNPTPTCVPSPGRATRFRARTYLPTDDALEFAADKLAFAARMHAAGVAVPESVDYDALDGDRRGDREVARRPRARVGEGPGRRRGACLAAGAHRRAGRVVGAVVDRREGHGGIRLHGCRDASGPRIRLSERVAATAQLVAGQARERVEYLYGHLTPSGQTSTPSVARTVAEPAVDDLAQRRIRALDPQPRGVYCVDIKESADGTAKVTEINAGRFFTTSNFFAAAGCNMPDMLVRAGTGRRRSHRSAPHRSSRTSTGSAWSTWASYSSPAASSNVGRGSGESVARTRAPSSTSTARSLASMSTGGRSASNSGCSASTTCGHLVKRTGGRSSARQKTTAPRWLNRARQSLPR